MRIRFGVSLPAICLFFASSSIAQTPLGPGFTYQGQFEIGGVPVNGTADLYFSLWDAPMGGNQIGEVQQRPGVEIVDGTFNTIINEEQGFGPDAFVGEARWLEIWVCGTPGCPSPEVLTPRQPITLAPYSSWARSAPWNGLTGVPNGFSDGIDNSGDSLWEEFGTDISYNGGKVGIGSATPHHQLRVSGGPLWTSNGWTGSLELDNVAAVGWRKNSSGQSFGIGQTNGGLVFFRTASEPGSATDPSNYDMVISDNGLVGVGGSPSGEDRFFVRGGDTIGTAVFGTPLKGPHYSHIHYGPAGDWYIRSAASYGKVILQDSGGYVGIGTTNPEYPLTVYTPLGYGLLHTDGVHEVGTYVNSQGGWLGTKSDHPLHFFTDNSNPQATLDTSGNLGVGIRPPTARLHAKSTGDVAAVRAEGGGSGGTALEIASGAIRVPGAGANTHTPAFVHVATAGNSSFCDNTGCYCRETVIDHPMTNGRPDAILFVTINGQAGEGDPMVDHVDYNTSTGKWSIWTQFGVVGRWFCLGQKFNVLVINP